MALRLAESLPGTVNHFRKDLPPSSRGLGDWENLFEKDLPTQPTRMLRSDGQRLCHDPSANRKMKQMLYLHRTCVPLELVDFEHQHSLFRPMTNECQGMCGG